MASLIFHGGIIRTLDEQQPIAGALAVAEGKILAVGELDRVERLRGPETRMIDLGGGVLLPAFVDHHLHLLNIGFSLLEARGGTEYFESLSELGSIEAIAEMLGKRAAATPAGSWILGKGWSQLAWGATELPDHRDLSQRTPLHPVFLTRVDGHAAWVNEVALRLAGIGKATPDLPGGAIRRRPDGEPTGVLLERAVEPVVRLLPPPDDNEIVAAFRLAAEALAAQGVTEVYDAGFLAVPGIVDLGLDLERYLRLLVATDSEQPLPLRINLMIPSPSALARKILEAPQSYRELSPRLRVTHIKLFSDGAMGSRGALLTHGFADDPTNRGVERMTSQQLRSEVEMALAAGFDVATHAIGDEAVRRAIDTYANALAEQPGLDPGRLRIEHFSYAREEDFQRAAELGVTLSVQPNFVAPDDHGVAMEDPRVGESNSRRVYAWGRLASLGASLAFGSDYFTKPFPPLASFYCAVTRRNFSARPADGWHPQERLAPLEALRILTRNHSAGGGDPKRGRLVAGAPADLVVLDADPLVAAEEQILAIDVRATYLDGTETYPASVR